MAVPASVRPFAPADLAASFALLHAQGWAHRLLDAPALQQLIAASQRVFIAEADGQLIGFARAISDGISNGYISMVVVAPEHRGQGIGRQLVQALMVGGPGISWMLRASRAEAPEFFAKLGFTPASDAMARPRSTPPAPPSSPQHTPSSAH